MTVEGVTDVTLDLELELAELTDETHIGPRICAIGGGHGLATALRAARRYAGSISAIVSVADDGGSSGRLTRTFGIPPPGDIRRCLLALAPEPSIWSELFAHRFRGGELDNHSLGNLLITALAELRGDFHHAVVEAGALLGAAGKVIPGADRATTLSARVGDDVIRGQAAIAKTRGPMQALSISPETARPHPDAIAAILGADQILIGPGSLYTSTIASLLVPGIVDAIEDAPGRVVFVLNLVTQDGETMGMDGEAHLDELLRHTGLERAGGIVAHAGRLAVPTGHDRVEIAPAAAERRGWTLTTGDVADHGAGWPAHDPAGLAAVLAKC